MLRGLLSAALLMTVSACLPPRENPDDPAIAPAARLSMVDLGPGLVCPPADLGLPFETATDISRGRCLGLDARASTDPQDQVLGDFKFTLPAALGFDERSITSTNGIVVFEREYREALPNDTSIEFRVRVRDPDKNRGFAVASAVLRNERPVAAIASGYSVPVGGVPWAAGLPVPLVIDGSGSSDPDDDSLRYCWSLPGAAEVCTAGEAGRRINFDAPITAGRYVVRLEVKDGTTGEVADGNTRLSRPAFAAIWVEPPALWEKGYLITGYDAVERLDNTPFAPINPPSSSLSRGVLYEPGTGDPLVVAEYTLTGTRRLRSYSYPGLVAGPELVQPVGTSLPVAMFPDPARGRVWVVREGPTNYFDVDAYVPDAIAAPTLLGNTVDIFIDGGRGELIELGGEGEIWLASLEFPLVKTVSGPSAAAQDVAPALDAVPIALGARPGSTEMWALVQEPDTAAFRVFPSATAPWESIDLGTLFASGFEWIDANEFWLATVEYDLVRVDADVLRESLEGGLPGDAALSLAITATVPVEVLNRDFVLDEETGELWSQTVRVGPDFKLHAGGLPLFIDTAGYPWTAGFGGLRRARSLNADKTLESVSLPQGAQQTSVDMSTGSLWVLTSDPTFLQEVTSEGLVGQRIPVLRFPGGAQLVPAYTEFAVSPDGRTAFAVAEESSVYTVDRIDVSTADAVESVVMDAGATGEYLYSYAGFAPSVLASPAFVWTAANDATNLYPVRISDGSVVRDTGVSISSQFGDNIGIARSAADDGACIATLVRTFISGSTYQLTHRLYRALPGQAAVQIDFRQFNYVGNVGGSYYTLAFVAATRSPSGGEMCWTAHVRETNPATNEVLTVFGGAVGLGTTRSLSFASTAGDNIGSAIPVSSDEVWFLSGTARHKASAPNGSGVLTVIEVVSYLDPLANGELQGSEAVTF